MSPEYIYNLLLQLNIPVAYDHFTSKDTKPPFVVYKCIDGDVFYADDKVFYDSRRYDVIVATEIKDVNLEERIEKILFDNRITWSKEENYLSSEKIYEIVYTI